MMDLGDWLDTVDAELVVRRYAAQDGRWSASICRCESMENGTLTSKHGNGPTPDEAVLELVDKIRGDRGVFDAMSGKRREFNVPKTITYA